MENEQNKIIESHWKNRKKNKFIRSKFDVFSHSRDGCSFPSQGETSRKNCYEVQASVTEKVMETICSG